MTPEIRPATTPRTPRPSHSLAAGQCQLLGAPTEGTTHPQKPTAIAAPVSAAAAKPATDLRGARGRGRRGRRAGSLGVRAPKRRPTVDAVVSAHERLWVGEPVSTSERWMGEVGAHMRMDTTARSMG